VEHSSSGDGLGTGGTAAQKGRTESSTNIKRWNTKKESEDDRFKGHLRRAGSKTGALS